MARPGKLFVFEGVDGSGKTTLSRALAEYLKNSSFSCDWFSFPGCEDGTLGKQVYDIHHDRLGVRAATINPTSLQLLHIAAHIDAMHRRILPALRQGRIVVLDRYWWSTLVYGTVAGADVSALKSMIKIELLSWGNMRPACVFLVRRKSPLGANLSLEEPSLAREYHKIAARERRKYKVGIIDNDRTVKEALNCIIRVAELDRQLSGILKVEPASRNGAGVSRITVDRPLTFSKLQPSKPTMVYDTYWRFATERQEIFFRKLIGDPPPWTKDTILSEYKFTNAYRASDRTSQYLIKNVIYDGEQTPEEVFFRTMLFKLFNRIDTWKLLVSSLGNISYREYAFTRYDSVLTQAMSTGKTIYSAAYIMPSGSRTSTNSRKHRMHLKLVEQMLKDNLPARLAEAPSMGKAFELLRAYPTIGDFLAYQYVTDLNYSTLLNFSEMQFVVPGPGARDGIRKCFSDLGGLNETDMIKVVTERQQTEFERLGLDFKSLWGRALQLIDCQNLFCEVDKYSRVKHPEFAGRTGRTRIKQKYRITLEPISFWYPPKWGLNEEIAKGGLFVSSV
jgi:thymidylate kinase